ncbi:hypothetical protein LTR50_004796 [Elasticomyces elasticus]|nr:hypothetical protein LTR50_004796 [Elasticomyces elasticus]
MPHPSRLFVLLAPFLALVHASAIPHVPQPSHGPHEDPLVVHTSSGFVHGTINPATPHVREFLGVPYAQPPVGPLRWEPPRPLSQPGANVQATALPPSCMQYLTTLGNSLYVRDVLQFNLQGLNRTGPVSEDCLTLSVWTPANPIPAAGGSNLDHEWNGEGHEWNREGHGRKHPGLPVLVFIYGGGFTTGGEDVPYQIPAQWVERTQDHVVVSFNYRVNLFGFPNAKGLSDQNLGLLDQRLVVEWLQQNIAGFGGDPNRMVLWGQSAGAMSVDFYNFAHPSDPIVTGLIMDSGTVFLPIRSMDTAHSNFSFVADHVGCGGLSSDGAAELACMKAVPATTLETFVANYQDSGALPRISFLPIADNKVVFANYTERALAGLQAKLVSPTWSLLTQNGTTKNNSQPAIVGTNAQDGVPFAPYNPAGPDPLIAQAALLNVFFCPATETIRVRQETGLTTYRYLYSGNFSNVSPRPWMGAYHSAELPLIMGTHPDFRGPSSELEYATSEAMQDAWVAFARDPVGGLAGQGWMPYTLGANDVREFGAGVAARDASVAANEAMCNGAAAAM